MSVISKIGWTDSSWSPLRVRVKTNAAVIAKHKGYTSLIQIATKTAGRPGHHCEHVSDGCSNCYSKTWQARCMKPNGTGLPFDRRARDLVDPFVDEHILMQPFHWRPMRLHEERCEKTLLGKAAACTCIDKHRFRPRRIFVESQSDLFGEWNSDEMIDQVFAVMAGCPEHRFQVLTKRPDRMLAYVTLLIHGRLVAKCEFPLANVHLGVSVEDQWTADLRIPKLLETLAAKRFVSYEPALAAVDFRRWIEHLDLIIVGGESGPEARPFDIQWARSTIEQCHEAAVLCFVKQLGARPFHGFSLHKQLHHASTDGHLYLHLKDRKGENPEEWPDGLAVQELLA